jgi:hypothetical protein
MCLHAKSGIRTHCTSVRVVGDSTCIGTYDHFNRYVTFSIKFSYTTCESIVWAKELLIFQIHSSHFKILDNKMLAWHNFHTEHSQILNANLKNLDATWSGARDLYTPGLGLRCSGILSDIGWSMFTEVSGHNMFPFFKGQAMLRGVPSIHDRPLYLACPDVLSLVGEFPSGDGWGSLKHI